MNPTFRHIDFAACGPAITRLDSITVRVWVNLGKKEHWKQLLELRLELTSLHFLGTRVGRCLETCYCLRLTLGSSTKSIFHCRTTQ